MGTKAVSFDGAGSMASLTARSVLCSKDPPDLGEPGVNLETQA